MPSKAGSILGSVIFFAVAPTAVAGWIPYTITRWRMQPPLLGLTAGRWAGGALMIAGLAVLLESFARFALVGGGTPAPIAPTRRLVVSGLYRHVRNPMYLAVVAAVLGQALLFGNARLLAYAGGVWALFHLFVVAYEEPTLRRQFGHSYVEYRQDVGRWWPRPRPRTSRAARERSGARSLTRAVLWGGAAAAILDIAAAFVVYGLRGATPIAILQAIASGWLGAQAFKGGAGTAALGLALHFLIAFTAAAVYAVASRRARILLERPVLAGMLYGTGVYLVMNWVVLPLSNVTRGRFSAPLALTILVVHMLCVGLPIALAVRRHAPAARAT